MSTPQRLAADFPRRRRNARLLARRRLRPQADRSAGRFAGVAQNPSTSPGRDAGAGAGGKFNDGATQTLGASSICARHIIVAGVQLSKSGNCPWPFGAYIGSIVFYLNLAYQRWRGYAPAVRERASQQAIGPPTLEASSV